MDLDGEAEEEALALIARGSGRCPLEAPDSKPITDEFLILPHPGEPGVQRDGTAAPLENPEHPGPSGSAHS